MRQTRGVRLTVVPSTSPADHDFTHDIRVRFVETDAMGIVHHSNYLAYFEEARVAFLADVGHPFTEWREAGLESPVLESFVQYRRPLRFDDVATVHLSLAAVTRTTFQMAYLLTTVPVTQPGIEPGTETVDESLDQTLAEASSRPLVCATGATVHGCVTTAGRPTRLPAWLVEMGSRSASAAAFDRADTPPPPSDRRFDTRQRG